MRLVIADDEACVRSALSLIFEQDADTEVIGEASDPGKLWSLLQTVSPDLILLDWELAEGKTSDLLADIRRNGLGGKVVVMSSRLEAKKEAIQAGADGFISKSDPPETVRQIIRKMLVIPSEN